MDEVAGELCLSGFRDRISNTFFNRRKALERKHLTMSEEERKYKEIKTACSEFKTRCAAMASKLYAATEGASDDDLAEANKLWSEYVTDMKDVLLLKIGIILSTEIE